MRWLTSFVMAVPRALRRVGLSLFGCVRGPWLRAVMTRTEDLDLEQTRNAGRKHFRKLLYQRKDLISKLSTNESLP